MVPVFKNVWERQGLQYNEKLESLNEKLVNDWIVDHLERNICYGLFLISNFFKWCLDLLQSIADLLTVVSDRIATNTTGWG